MKLSQKILFQCLNYINVLKKLCSEVTSSPYLLLFLHLLLVDHLYLCRLFTVHIHSIVNIQLVILQVQASIWPSLPYLTENIVLALHAVMVR